MDCQVGGGEGVGIGEVGCVYGVRKSGVGV